MENRTGFLGYFIFIGFLLLLALPVLLTECSTGKITSTTNRTLKPCIMQCPNCGEDNNKVHKTHSEYNFMLEKNMRTRYCYGCGYFFETVEAPSGDPYKLKNKRRRKRPEI